MPCGNHLKHIYLFFLKFYLKDEIENADYHD